MNTVLGILLIVAGVAYPLVALAWLNRRMSRSPGLSSRQVGLILALDGILPISLIFWGLGLMVPRLRDSFGMRVVALATAIAALVLLVAIAFASRLPEGGAADTEPRETTTDGR